MTSFEKRREREYMKINYEIKYEYDPSVGMRDPLVISRYRHHTSSIAPSVRFCKPGMLGRSIDRALK